MFFTCVEFAPDTIKLSHFTHKSFLMTTPITNFHKAFISLCISLNNFLSIIFKVEFEEKFSPKREAFGWKKAEMKRNVTAIYSKLMKIFSQRQKDSWAGEMSWFWLIKKTHRISSNVAFVIHPVRQSECGVNCQK